MKIYCKSRKSHRWNEDRFIIGNGFGIVLDGATPLKKSGRFNEARWFVNYIKKNISHYGGDVKSRLSALSRDAYSDFPAEKEQDDYLPSAGACWAEWSGNNIKIGLLGDCEVTAITVDGKILRFTDDRLKKLDEAAIREMTGIARERKITVAEARKFINDVLIAHRKLINKPNGYSALTPSKNADIDETVFSLERNEVKTLFLYSDGFSQAFENLKIYNSHSEMFQKIDDIDEVIENIVKISYGDRTCDKYPRFKVIDDITVVKIDF